MKASVRTKILAVIKEGIFLLFVFVMAFLIGMNFFAPNALMHLVGFTPYVVQSDSMKPLFSRGDIVVVVEANTNRLMADDIIAVRGKSGVRFAHFIAEQYIDEDNRLRFKTRPYGSTDKSQWDYESLRREQILGKVSMTIPRVGHLALFLRKPIGLITVGINAVLIFLLLRSLTKKKGEYRSDQV